MQCTARVSCSTSLDRLIFQLPIFPSYSNGPALKIGNSPFKQLKEVMVTTGHPSRRGRH